MSGLYGRNFFGVRGVARSVGRQVRIEHDNDIYHFAPMTLTERARLIWSRRGETGQKLRSILHTAFRRRS